MAFSGRLLLADSLIETGRTLTVTSPFDGSEIGRAALGDRSHLEAAIAAAEKAYAETRRTAPHERAALLLRIAGAIEARKEEFAQLIVGEAGKPVTSARGEVARAVMTFTVAAEEARRPQGELLGLDGLPPGQQHFGMVRRFPLGVVAAITPFNFPLNLVAHKVAPCLATGNTMVLKPASKTPLTALLLGEVLLAAGMPPGQVNIVPCSNEDAALLVRDERIKKLTFTGSPAVGWKLKEQCGRKRITLELGGNAGVVIHADADLAAAVPAVAMGGFSAAGQSCISVQRVLVQEQVYEEFRERLIAHTREQIHAGDPREERTVVGPMISREALEKIQERIAAAVAGGATILHGGKVTGTVLEATILEGVPPECELNAEEAFAPVVLLQRYGDFEEALRVVNDSRYGLQAGVFTRDLARAFQAYEALEVGGVLINQVPTWRVESMPYGGIKDSGFGREGVRYAMEEMTELKSLIVKLC